MSDQKRGERQPLPPGVQGDIVHIFGDFMTVDEMRQQMPSSLQIGSKTLQISTKTVNEVMRHEAERQRLERAVVDAALASRRAWLAVMSLYDAENAPELNLPDWQDRRQCLVDARSIADEAEEAACDALAAFLEAQGEEKR